MVSYACSDLTTTATWSSDTLNMGKKLLEETNKLKTLIENTSLNEALKLTMNQEEGQDYKYKLCKRGHQFQMVDKICKWNIKCTHFTNVHEVIKEWMGWTFYSWTGTVGNPQGNHMSTSAACQNISSQK